VRVRVRVRVRAQGLVLLLWGQGLAQVQVQVQVLLWAAPQSHRRSQGRQWQGSKNCCASIRRSCFSRLHRLLKPSY